MKLSSKELKPLFMESICRLDKEFEENMEKLAGEEKYIPILSDAFKKSKDSEGCANLCTMIAAMCVYSSYRIHTENRGGLESITPETERTVPFPIKNIDALPAPFRSNNTFDPHETQQKNLENLLTYCKNEICKNDKTAADFYTRMFDLIDKSAVFEERYEEIKHPRWMYQSIDAGYQQSISVRTITDRKIIYNYFDSISCTCKDYYLSEYIEEWYKLYCSPYAKENHLEVPAYFLHLYNVTAYNDFLIALTDSTRTFSFDEISRIENEIIDNLSPEFVSLDGSFDNADKQVQVKKESHEIASAYYISSNGSKRILYHLLPHTMYNYFSLNHNRTIQYQLKIAKLEKEFDGNEKKRARGEITEKEAQDEMVDKIKHIQSELSRKSIPKEIEHYFGKMLSIEGLSDETKQDIKLTKELMGSIGIGVDIFMLPLFRSLERELNKKIFDKIRENLSKAHIKAQCKDKYIRNLFPCSNPTIMLGFHFKDILKPNKYYNKKYTKEERNQCKADLRLIHNKIDNADHGLENFKKIVNISRNNFACVDMYLSRIRNAICHRIDDDIEKIRGAEENLAKEILICFSETYEVFKAICEIGNNLT